MKGIIKGPEPLGLLRYRKQVNAKYENLPISIKNTIRISLLNEQGYICAYCMRRVEQSSMKIEHWHSQSKHPNKQLIYSNLLACCQGGIGSDFRSSFCDNHKGDDDILYNPANKKHHSHMKIRYLGDGVITSDDTQFNCEINKILNLNNPILKSNRKMVIKAVCKVLNSRSGTRTYKEIQRLLDNWQSRNANGHLPEYCDVAIYYLGKKINN